MVCTDCNPIGIPLVHLCEAKLTWIILAEHITWVPCHLAQQETLSHWCFSAYESSHQLGHQLACHPSQQLLKKLRLHHPQAHCQASAGLAAKGQLCVTSCSTFKWHVWLRKCLTWPVFWPLFSDICGRAYMSVWVAIASATAARQS